jgi:hypothetical protein
MLFALEGSSVDAVALLGESVVAGVVAGLVDNKDSISSA